MRKSLQGFNVIELMVVVAIVGIIAAFGYPSYMDSVRKSARKMGATVLIEVTGRQEQYFVNTKSYATDLTNLGYPSNGFYIDNEGDELTSATNSIYLIEFASASATAYTVRAVPQGNQANDSPCMTLSVTNAGNRSATGAAPTTCW